MPKKENNPTQNKEKNMYDRYQKVHVYTLHKRFATHVSDWPTGKSITETQSLVQHVNELYGRVKQGKPRQKSVDIHQVNENLILEIPKK